AEAVTDARLADQRVLLIFADPAKSATRQLFHIRYEDENTRRDFDPYRLVPVAVDEKALPAATELAKHLNIRLEKRSFPLLLVYDTEEVQVALSDTGPLSKGDHIDCDRLLQFLKAHAPRALDAQKLLADTLAQAKKEKKR